MARIGKSKKITVDATIGQMFRRFSRAPGCAFLDSSLRKHDLGRYWFLMCDPVRTVSVKDRHARWSDGERVWEDFGTPFSVIDDHLKSNAGENQSDLPFAGGAVGYFGYDSGRFLEELPSVATDDLRTPDARFGFYESGLAYDSQEGQWHLFWQEINGRTSASIGRIQEMVVEAMNDGNGVDDFECSGLKSNFTLEEYLKSVATIQSYIGDGEVYQVNLAQRFEAVVSGSSASLYLKLRELNPSPYSAYLDLGDEQIMSNSPERFLTKTGRHLETRPIKGTRPRGSSSQEDHANRESLKQSAKDRAELLMIVDLERNDLGRVCVPGSVRTRELFRIEDYPTVYHQTGAVSGELKNGFGVIDSLKAMMPGGSITGAPKIRAMEIIDRLEPVRRGVYTGSIGYIGYDGNCDFSIAIRTIVRRDKKVFFHVGGGIVWDSDPMLEYEETLHKGRAMIEALGARLP